MFNNKADIVIQNIKQKCYSLICIFYKSNKFLESKFKMPISASVLLKAASLLTQKWCKMTKFVMKKNTLHFWRF